MATKSSKPMSRADRLEALKAKLKKTDLGGGGAGFWSPKVGRNQIRIIPEVGSMEFFFQTVGRHFFPDGRNAYCPKFTSEEKLECPICELVNELYKAGDKQSKKLAQRIGLRRSYWMNIINREDEDAGPLVFTPGSVIFNQIVNLINDPDYGEVYDIDEGLDLTIERVGQGINTEYQTVARRKSTPLSEDQDLIDEWLGAAKDLSYVEVTDDPDEDKELSQGHAVYVLPYNRLVEEFGLDEFDVDKFEVEDDDEDARPSRKPAAKATSKATSKRKVEEEEPEEDNEGGDDGEDPEPKKEVQRRLARRSSRR